MTNKDTPETGKLRVTNYAEVPVDLLLAMGLGETFPLKARILILLADQHSRKAGDATLTYRQIGDVLGVDVEHVGARCRELIRSPNPLVERTKDGVRFRWRGLSTDLPGLKAYQALSRETKGLHSLPLRAYREGNEERALDSLPYRLTDEEFEWLQSKDAFGDLGFWARQLPKLLEERKMVNTRTSTEVAVLWAVQGVVAYGRERPVSTPTALMQAMVKSPAKYGEYLQPVDANARHGLPTLEQRLRGDDATLSVPPLESRPEETGDDLFEDFEVLPVNATAPEPEPFKPVSKPVSKPVATPEPSKPEPSKPEPSEREPEPANDAPPARPERDRRLDATMGMVRESSLYDDYETPGMREQREEREAWERVKAAKAAARARASA